MQLRVESRWFQHLLIVMQAVILPQMHTSCHPMASLQLFPFFIVYMSVERKNDFVCAIQPVPPPLAPCDPVCVIIICLQDLVPEPRGITNGTRCPSLLCVCVCVSVCVSVCVCVCVYQCVYQCVCVCVCVCVHVCVHAALFRWMQLTVCEYKASQLPST